MASASLVMSVMSAALMVSVMSTAIVVVTASTFAVAASAVMVFDVLDEAFHLVVGSLASFDDSAFEVQVLSRQRVVEVNRHFIVADAHHASQESVAVFVL